MRRLLSIIPVPIRRHYIGIDHLYHENNAGKRFTPVRVDKNKVTNSIRNQVLSKRQLQKPLTIERGKKLLVIIPYRDREQHLNALLPELQSSLSAQGIDYHLVISEQAPGKLFNKGRLINVAAKVMLNDVDYLCIHDVDNVPESAEYGCPSQPMRLIGKWSSSWRDYDLTESGAFGVE